VHGYVRVVERPSDTGGLVMRERWARKGGG
jgi:hypothetical protein